MNHRSESAVRVLLISAWQIAFVTVITVCASAGASEPQPPLLLSPTNETPFLAAMPDGSIGMIFARQTSGRMEVMQKRTNDNGRTWSEPETLYVMDRKDFGSRLPWATMPLVTADGRLQLFWMVERGTGGNPAVDYFIDILHSHSLDCYTQWTPPQAIFKGYVGSLNGMAQLANGRILLPFAYWIGGQPEGPPFGCNVTTCVYSDDNGDTWKQSPAKLQTPCTADHNGAGEGAIEPTVLQLADGRVWMLIRTQVDRLYESFSDDGVAWSAPKPSRFHSSDSPAWLMRLPDKRIVLFWNNCENTSRVDGQGVYTNRDALHAAISSDEGKTWHGYREVYLDPLRNQSPPKAGDRGTAYPYPVATPDGKILLVTGQGERRRCLVLLDPNWLEQTCRKGDFSSGLDNWSVFTSVGPAANWWRDRTQGAILTDHPGKPNAKVLHVRRPGENDADGAVWNFPLGRQGRVCVQLLLQPGCQGVSLALADRHIQPTDSVGEKKVVFQLPIAADGRLPNGTVLRPGQWYTIALQWDLDKRSCQVLLDGQPAGTLLAVSEDSPGLCYLRLRSTATDVDTAGMLIESVRADTSGN